MRLRFRTPATFWGTVLSGAAWLGAAAAPAQGPQMYPGGGYPYYGGWPMVSSYPGPALMPAQHPCPAPMPPQFMPLHPPQAPTQLPAPMPTTPPAQAPTQPVQPQAPVMPAEPTLGFEQFAAVGGQTVALADSGVGYIDTAVIRSQVRLRYDTAYDNIRPDRAEFFYPKCGCFGTPDALGPPLDERSVDYQEVMTYLEFAPSDRWSGFVELPQRFINPDVNANSAGLGDITAGFKFGLYSSCDRLLTFQLRSFFPTGDGDRGLGTEHYSLEPALLLWQRLSDRLILEAEVRDWIPIDGSDFAGNVIRYGVGLRCNVYQSCNCWVAPVAEFVGWTVLDGKVSSFGGLVEDADGDTIVNAKLGVRAGMGNSSMYVGYGRALTGDVWYDDIIRVEYRLGF
jgi:hypothetical protein